MATSDKLERATVTIEEAAHILGIGRASAYEAARTGQLPVLRLGVKRLVVPKRALERLLDAGGLEAIDRNI
jgi:excisionase family DNA binding protein